ncbi:MAG TPA: IPT/TIG domain-containing protein [Terriglobia bacterium]
MRKIGGSPGIVASFLLVLLAASSVAARGQSNPVPLVNEPLVPGSAVPGGKSFTLTVNGTGFARGASVNWNGSPLLTVVNNQGKLTATVPAAAIATVGTAYVTVTNPGAAEASNTVLFPIAQPSATIAFAGSNVATLSSPVVLGVADFNGDGYLDIALVTIYFADKMW